MNKSLLNLGAGKFSFDDFPGFKLVIHLDQSYTDSVNKTIEHVEQEATEFYLLGSEPKGRTVCPCKCDLYDFLYSWPFKFDHINADRIFEHQFYDSGQVGQLLDACNQITEDDATMIIVVPNHRVLAKLLIEYDDSVWPDNSKKLLFNTEFCNTSSDPHGSIWTPQTAREMIQAEGGTWKIDDLQEQYEIKGRSCYMRIKLVK